MFVWDYDNFIESKPKQIINTNSKSTKYRRVKLEKKNKKDLLERKKNYKMEFKRKKKWKKKGLA
jgi:hypothetical protein